MKITLTAELACEALDIDAMARDPEAEPVFAPAVYPAGAELEFDGTGMLLVGDGAGQVDVFLFDEAGRAVQLTARQYLAVVDDATAAATLGPRF